MSKKITKFAIDTLLKKGADKAECWYIVEKNDELNIHNEDIDLFRTKKNIKLKLEAIKDNKKGEITLNEVNKENIKKQAKNLIDIALSSKEDPAHDISSEKERKTFKRGPESPDYDLMFENMDHFIKAVKNDFPKINVEKAIYAFNNIEKTYHNSNNVFLKSNRYYYNFTTMFLAEDNEKSSSFNYISTAINDPKQNLLNQAELKTLLSQSIDHLNPKPVPEKFVGDIIITPHALQSLIRFITSYLRDSAIITKRSIYKDKINEKIASDKFNLHSAPLSEKLAYNYFITSDGFIAKDLQIIENGVLKSFLLSLYGANKTNHKRSLNQGGNFIIEPGDKNLEQIINNTEKGIILRRFSGGNPSDSGDFSGIAKNSFYIENGEIKHPLKETMISGNLASMLKDIKAISKERINFGSSIFPWISTSNFTISSK